MTPSIASLSVLLLLLPAAYGQMYGAPAYGGYAYGGYGMPYGYGGMASVTSAPVTKPEPTPVAEITDGVLATVNGQQSTPLTQQDLGPTVSWQTVFYGINSTEFDMIKEEYAEALAATITYDKPMATDFAFSAVDDMGMLNVTNEVVWPDGNATAANEFAAKLQSDPSAIYNSTAMQELFPESSIDNTVSGVDVSMPLSAAAPTGLPSNSTEVASKKSTDLSGGAIAGIVIGVLAGVALLAGAVFFLVTRGRRANSNTAPLL